MLDDIFMQIHRSRENCHSLYTATQKNANKMYKDETKLFEIYSV